jgi:pimeloyl-ACP methyl ester carboxylesterase
MEMNYVRLGRGRPLLLLHGLGGTWRSWIPIMGRLALNREVIAVDLPGFGATPPLIGKVSIETFADAITNFISAHHLHGIDTVGSSMGGRLALELARRGGNVVGAVVALAPGGFRSPKLRHVFYWLMILSRQFARVLQPILPLMTRNVIGRTILFAPFSMRPWKLPPDIALGEIQHYAASKSFNEIVYDMAYGSPQQGAPKNSIPNQLAIAWGKWDLICFPQQAKRAIELFPDASLEWFENVGHFPHWDIPDQTAELILLHTKCRETPPIEEEGGLLIMTANGETLPLVK